jgi:transposase-like protein
MDKFQRLFVIIGLTIAWIFLKFLTKSDFFIFLIPISILLYIIIEYFVSLSYKVTCPKCDIKMNNLELEKKELLRQQWDYQRKDGMQDQRYNDNELHDIYLCDYKCKNCGNKFSLELSDSDLEEDAFW